MRTVVTFQSEATEHKEMMRKKFSWTMSDGWVCSETCSQQRWKLLLGTFQPRDSNVRQAHERNSYFHFSWTSLSQQGQVGKYTESELESKRFGSTSGKTKGQDKFLLPGLKEKSLETWQITDGTSTQWMLFSSVLWLNTFKRGSSASISPFIEWSPPDCKFHWLQNEMITHVWTHNPVVELIREQVKAFSPSFLQL